MGFLIERDNHCYYTKENWNVFTEVGLIMSDILNEMSDKNDIAKI